MAVHRFDDLASVIDDVHALFDAWEADGTFARQLDDFGLNVLRLAVHEWVANLVQHASFGSRRPEIALDVEGDGAAVRCRIDDNSDGFDFHRQLTAQEAVVGGPEPSERGRGLLMLIACTEDLAYTPAAGGPPPRQRLQFVIRPPAGDGAATGVAPLFHLRDEA